LPQVYLCKSFLFFSRGLGIPKKRKGEGCLSALFRSESSSPDRAISYPWRAIFRGCIMQGRKTAKGSKNRLKIDHIIIIACFSGPWMLRAFVRGRAHALGMRPVVYYSTQVSVLVMPFCAPVGSNRQLARGNAGCWWLVVGNGQPEGQPPPLSATGSPPPWAGCSLGRLADGGPVSKFIGFGCTYLLIVPAANPRAQTVPAS
jgi:hypothetical protein